MNLLHLDSSILGDNSVSRTLSAAVVAQLKKNQPGLHETYRDLAAAPLPHLSGAYLAAAQNPDGAHDATIQADLKVSAQVMEEFLAADVVVLGMAMYNFTISTQLKAWIDRIAVAGKTFRYTANGPEGLAGDKRVILAIARGGLYSPGMPAAPFEHGETYLRTVFGFLASPTLKRSSPKASPSARNSAASPSPRHARKSSSCRKPPEPRGQGRQVPTRASLSLKIRTGRAQRSPSMDQQNLWGHE